MSAPASGVTVRRIKRNESEQLRRLRLRALADSPSFLGESATDAEAVPADEWRASVEEAAESDDTAIFIAEISGDFVACVFASSPSSQPREQIGGMWVAPEWRGLGLGRQLSVAAIAWLREIGAVDIRLSATQGNEVARRLYEHLGFVATGELEPLDSDPSLTVEYMYLDLTALERAEEEKQRRRAHARRFWISRSASS